MKPVILTGSAYAGKSTSVEILRNRGYKIIPETDTLVVQELVREHGAKEAGRWLLENYPEFKRRVGEVQRRLEESIGAEEEEPVFFDRSAICYIAFCNLRDSEVPENIERLAAKTRPYKAFLLEAVPEFDEREESGRVMTEAEASRLVGLIEAQYHARDIPLIRVPFMDKEERVDYIVRRALTD